MEREVSGLQDEINSTLSSGHMAIAKTSMICDVDEIKQKHKDASDKWTAFKVELLKKSARLEEIGQLSDVFNGRIDNLSAWTALINDKLSWQQPDVQDQDVVNKQLADVQLTQNELMRRAPEVEMLKKDGEKLMQLGDTDQDHVQKQLDDFVSEWNRLLAGDKLPELILEDQFMDDFIMADN